MKQSKRNLAKLEAKAKREKPERSRYANKGGSYDYSELYERAARPKSNRG